MRSREKMMTRPTATTKSRDDEGIDTRRQARQCLSRRRKESRPAELIRAAQDVFVEKGFAATRLEDVAARAGVAKGTVYLYFESKEVLFKAVIETGMAPAIATIEALAAPAANIDRPAVELLRGHCDAWQRMMRETSMASLLKLLVAESGNFPEVVQWFNDSAVRPAMKVLADIAAAGIACGDFRPVATEMVANVFFSLVWRCAFDKAWGGDLLPPERFLEQAFEILARGIVNAPAN